jgi:hypothetical protein
MGAAFRKALATDERILRSQRDWIGERTAKCSSKGASEIVKCIRVMTLSRTSQLSQIMNGDSTKALPPVGNFESAQEIFKAGVTAFNGIFYCSVKHRIAGRTHGRPPAAIAASMRTSHNSCGLKEMPNRNLMTLQNLVKLRSFLSATVISACPSIATRQ